MGAADLESMCLQTTSARTTRMRSKSGRGTTTLNQSTSCSLDRAESTGAERAQNRGRSPERHSHRDRHPHRPDHSKHQQQGSRNNRYDDRRGQKRSKQNVDPADIKIGGTEWKSDFKDNGSIITCNKLECSKATLCRVCKCGFDDKC